QRLTPEQEDFLVQWILEEEARAFPPSHARAREMANRILRMNGDHRPVGKHWMAAFLKRNPRVASVVGRKIEAARAKGATPVQIRAFLELFERTLLASS
ncbi:transposase-like protein, partial [Pyrenophora tritici-repentis]